MKNTVLTAKNSFQEGLIMDFSPSVTRNDCMTSALNATLLTFNGNEMSLQNDMGNGRVETAFLPEGYTPVGTCEFGDIIYIISYNPMINKAQIGCFPSPERNISSDELFDNSNITIQSEDFQQLDSNNEPTGELKALSVKKILFDKDMHSGDQYIIYSNDNLDMSYISDFGNTDRVKGSFPKLVKISIVSIDESGKMTYIDSNVKWYNNDYYLNYCNAADSTGLQTDIDSYRSLVSSAYNTFASKTPGKLALLFELERINSFDVSWECYEIEKTETYSLYDLYWNFNWETSHNDININKVILSRNSLDSLNSPNSNKLEIISELPLNRDVVFDITRHYSPEELKNYEVENTTLQRLMNYNEYKEIKFDTIVSNYTTKTKVSRYITTTDESININPGRYNYFDETEKEFKIDNICDTIINNYYKIPVTKKFATFKLYHNRTGSAIFNYSLTPAMPYGKLDDLKISGYIDFDKISNTNLGINTWKYYVNDNTISLTYGLDAVVSEGKVVKDVRLEFYDNQGLAAIYSSPPRSSYNGTFTNTFILNTKDAKLTNVTKNGTVHYHTNGIYKKYNDLSTEEFNDYFISDATHVFIKKENEENIYFEIDMQNVFWGTHKYDSNNKTYTLASKKAVEKNEANKANNPTVYQNDCGILYKNQLYLVKIILTIGYDNTVSSETETTEIFERWMWTSEIFNNEYYSKKDFIELTPELSLNVEGQYKIVPDEWKWEEKTLKSDQVSQPLHLGLSAIQTKLNSDDPNIKLKLHVGLVNNYNMFNLWNNETNNLSQIEIYIMEGNHQLKNYNDQPKIKYVNGNLPLLESIYPIIDLELTGEETEVDLPIYQTEESYLDYKDSTKLSIIEPDFNKAKLYNMKYNEIMGSYVSDGDGSKINYEDIDIETIPNFIKKFLSLELDENSTYAYLDFTGVNGVSINYINPIKFFKFYTLSDNDLSFTVNTVPEVVEGIVDIGIDKITVTSEKPNKSNGLLLYEAKIIEVSEAEVPKNTNFTTLFPIILPRETITDANNTELYKTDIMSGEDNNRPCEFYYLKRGFLDQTAYGNTTTNYAYYRCIIYTDEISLETHQVYVSGLEDTTTPTEESSLIINGDSNRLLKNILYNYPNLEEITATNLSSFKDEEMDNIIFWSINSYISKDVDRFIKNEIKEIIYMPAKTKMKLYADKIIYLDKLEYKTNFTVDAIKFEVNSDNVIKATDIINTSNIINPGYYLFTKETDSENTIDKMLSLAYSESDSVNFSEKITYVDTNSNFIELDTSKITTYKYNAQSLLDYEISLMLKSVKYDKYYRETENALRQIERNTIKSLLYTSEDLEEYNLVLAETENKQIIPMFKNGFTMGFGNMAGNPSHIERSLVDLVETKENSAYYSLLTTDDTTKIKGKRDNFFGSGPVSGSRDRNISYKKMNNKEHMDWTQKKYNDNTAARIYNGREYTIYDKVFFPIFLMHTVYTRGGYSDGDKKTKWSRNENLQLEVPELYRKGKDDHITLNGSLALLNENNMYIQDDWCSGNAKIFAEKLITFLRNIYYLDNTEPINKYEPYTKNYAYLEDNYSLYTRDIVTYVKFTNNINVNDLLLIQSGSYSNYLEQLKQWSDSNIDVTNTEFKLNNVIKNIPFQLRQDYKIPYESTSPDIIKSKEIIVESPDPSFINTTITFELERGILYGYDGKELKPLSNLKTIEYDKNATYAYKQNEDGGYSKDSNGNYLLSLISSEDLELSKLDVSTLCSKNNIFALGQQYRSDDTDIVKLKYNGNSLKVSKDTYSMMLSKNGSDNIGLIDFETNLKFFKNE